MDNPLKLGDLLHGGEQSTVKIDGDLMPIIGLKVIFNQDKSYCREPSIRKWEGESFVVIGNPIPKSANGVIIVPVEHGNAITFFMAQELTIVR